MTMNYNYFTYYATIVTKILNAFLLMKRKQYKKFRKRPEATVLLNDTNHIYDQF